MLMINILVIGSYWLEIKLNKVVEKYRFVMYNRPENLQLLTVGDNLKRRFEDNEEAWITQ